MYDERYIAIPIIELKRSECTLSALNHPKIGNEMD